MYDLRFTPRVDCDFFEDDPLELLKTAPIKSTMIGINEVEMLVYGDNFSQQILSSMEEINLNLALTDYQEILFQNVHAAKWHEFFLPDLSDFVSEQLAKSKY